MPQADASTRVSFANVVHGRDSLKRYFQNYMAKLGKLGLLSPDNFVETSDSILFEATVRTSEATQEYTMRSCSAMIRLRITLQD